MTRFLSCTTVSIIILLCGSAGLCTTFDERLWEKYAEVETSLLKSKDGLAVVYLEPAQLGDVASKSPFADFRVETDRREEVPYQIVARRPEQRMEELQAQLHNLSRTEKGETWLELLVDRQNPRITAVEIITPDADFSRQVQVLGSSDGTSWNTLRKDGVIFDVNRGEKLRHTSITFPQASFRHLALKIVNGDAQPLTISGVKVLQDNEVHGQTYSIYGTTEKPESDASRKENSIVVRMKSVFPLDRLTIGTSERNFQRTVEVQIKRGNGDWERWAQGTIFNFDTATMHESQMTIDIPEIAAREFRLIFRNLDSPPIPVTTIAGEGYRRLLVFKHQPDRKLYLFWGNPQAQQPHYDLAGLMAKQKLDELAVAPLGQVRPNTKFAGNNARLPFTERYKYPLYVIVAVAIAGLLSLQYRVLRRVQDDG